MLYRTPLAGKELLRLEREEDDFVLLECCRPGADDDRSLLFTRPEATIICRRPADVPAALELADEALREGRYLAGYMAYEAGAAFEQAVPCFPSSGPLLRLGVYGRPRLLPSGGEETDGGLDAEELFSLDDIRLLGIERERYGRDIARIKELIAAGETYQINYTAELSFDFRGSAAALYDRLRRAQPVPYSAFMKCGGRYVLSLSPELFLRIDGERITSRPMKGTAPREVTQERDAAVPGIMAADPKTRAENLMIVDLIRNDLGRVCRTGSVRVPHLFTAERHPTLWQMTSTVEGRLRPGMTLGRIMAALFPCGSVTGAPKIRSMQIIGELERRPRGVYTGAVGWMGPGGGCFNVPIRTIELDTAAGRGIMGVGSGIVWDSDPEAEYRECLLKGRFLTDVPESFKLLETLLWRQGEGYVFLEEHLERLCSSAVWFGFTCHPAGVRQALEELCRDCRGPQRVRLLLGEDGGLELEKAPLPGEDIAGPRTVVWARRWVDSEDRFLYHKTTRRAFYESELTHARALGHWEVIFRNERDELTEGSFCNLFLRRGGELLTPPLDCGLLPGVLRRHLLETGEAREEILRPEDLAGADEVLLGNSVRGLVPVQRPFV